jgi:PAS domain-containing protein
MFKLSGVEIMKNNRIELIEGVRHQLKDILESSKQAIYVYLDDTHKLCNQRFATLLGYGSTREWENIGCLFRKRSSQIKAGKLWYPLIKMQ